MPHRFRPSPRAILSFGLYVAALVFLVVPLLAQIAGSPSQPRQSQTEPLPSGLVTALDAAFDGASCVSTAAAVKDVRERLDQLGLNEWTIHSTATTPDQCVNWSLVELSDQPRTVTLLPTLSPEVRSAMAAVREETFARCLARDQTIALVTRTLSDMGESGFDVRVDGPFQVPIGREAEVIAHYEAGCWTYSTYGWSGKHFEFFVSGKASPEPSLP
jgi:hypothetical protein